MRSALLSLLVVVAVEARAGPHETVAEGHRGSRTMVVNQQHYPSLLYINAAAGTTSVDTSPSSSSSSDIINLILYPYRKGGVEAKQAVVVLGHGTATGTLTLTQAEPPVGPTVVQGLISNLSPGYHGFHIHQHGSLANGCVSAGGHYNPYKRNHGAPYHLERHVGDLGNIIANETGHAEVHISDPLVTLVGPRSVVGRAVVVHAGEDDLGLGGNPDSLKTGNAGGRVGCGVIGHA